jgi:hypothetical protein
MQEWSLEQIDHDQIWPSKTENKHHLKEVRFPSPAPDPQRRSPAFCRALSFLAGSGIEEVLIATASQARAESAWMRCFGSL